MEADEPNRGELMPRRDALAALDQRIQSEEPAVASSDLTRTMQDPLLSDGSAVLREPAGIPGRPESTWVDELAGPEDYWLTLTDAARVTRRQEVTIRRWVAAGSLPVRRRPLGLNKRTRHVRASDLSQLTPIVDAGATISGATAQIDLLSIPVQQANILAQQHEIEENVRALAAQVAEATSSQQALIEEHAKQLSQIENAVGQIQTDVGTHIQQAAQQHAETASQLTALQEEVRHTTNHAQQLHGELHALRADLEGYAERQAEQQEIQLQHGARIERLEPLAKRIHEIEERQARGAKDQREQRHQVEDLAIRVSSQGERLRQVAETLTSDISARVVAQQATEQQIDDVRTSVTHLRKEMHQGISSAVKTSTDLKQQLEDSQNAVRAASTSAHEVAEHVAEQRDQIEQLSEQVALLSAMIHELMKQGDQESQTVRQRRSRRSVRLKTEEQTGDP
ncbi:MAG: hypothetical protein ACLQUY_27815 [Ktedonobacterales bacterium]